MIIRQFVVRHGRSALVTSLQCAKRTFATEITNENRAFRPSTNDQEPGRKFSGHPSDPSSIIDQSTLPSTRDGREVAQRLADIIHETSSIQGDINAYTAAKAQQEPPVATSDVTSEQPPTNSKANSKRLDSFYSSRRQQRKLSNLGSNLINVHEPWAIVKNPPRPYEITLPMLLANQTHLGHATALWNPNNSSYIFGIRDGIHIISLDITLAYLRRAAKVVREVAKRGGVILFVGTRKGQQEIVVNAAKLAEGYHIFDRWVAGILTNGQQILGNCALKVVDIADKEIEEYREVLKDSNHPVAKPDLVICLNPLENEACLHECGIYSVPTIGVIDTDANPSWVTYPIPANDDSFRSIGLIAGALGRAAQEGQSMRKEAAKSGDMIFDTRIQTQAMLSEIAELSNIQVEARGNKDKDTDKDA